MFTGRTRELEKMETLYQRGRFECIILYGRRRVGKTTLINEFIKDKPAIYYMAVEGTKKENLAGFSRAIFNSRRKDSIAGGVEFPDFESLLKYIDELARSGERHILAIDEFPYLASSYPTISSLLQSHIDQCWKDSRLYLILCGSSMSFMEEQVLGYKSPLYGRRTAQFKLHPFTFFEAAAMLDSFSLEERAILYGVTGGIPEYISRIQPGADMDTAITSLFFEESGRLFEEPSNLLKQELREPASYHSILSAVAGGASRMNEIATKTGLETGGCSNQLASLIALEIVKKERPITENESSRKTLYRLADSMFLFWYRFVRPNISAISAGAGQMVYQHIVKPQMNDFMGTVFETICLQYLYLPQVYKGLPFPLGNAGRWWGNNPEKRRQEEIDIMAVQGQSALFCECKWRQNPIGADVAEMLVERGQLFRFESRYFIVFSKTGFQEDAVLYKETRPHLQLVSFEDMAIGF